MAIIGETSGQRREREGVTDELHRKSEQIAELTGEPREYIDQFTTVKDDRTVDEVFARLPKCCVRLPNGRLDLKGE